MLERYLPVPAMYLLSFSRLFYWPTVRDRLTDYRDIWFTYNSNIRNLSIYKYTLNLIMYCYVSNKASQWYFLDTRQWNSHLHRSAFSSSMTAHGFPIRHDLNGQIPRGYLVAAVWPGPKQICESRYSSSIQQSSWMYDNVWTLLCFRTAATKYRHFLYGRM